MNESINPFVSGIHGNLRDFVRLFICLMPILTLASCHTATYYNRYGEGERREAIVSPEYMEWGSAREYIRKNCLDIIDIYQGHSRVVEVSFSGGRKLVTVSPEIDQILHLLDECEGRERFDIWME